MTPRNRRRLTRSSSSVEAEVLEPGPVEPAHVHLVEVPIRFQPRNRLSACRSKSDQQRLSSPPVARPAAQQTVPKSPQSVNHSKQLEHMCRVVPLRRRELPALVRDRMLQALVFRVQLRQDRRDGIFAGICRKHRWAGRVECVQYWS